MVLVSFKAIALVDLNEFSSILTSENNLKPPDNHFNPILTGLFESKFLLGGVNLTPPPPPPLQIAVKFCMDVKTHVKSIATNLFLMKTVYYIIRIYAN